MTVAFDTLQYVKGAEAVHIKREHAEYQAQQLAAIIHNDVASKEDIHTLSNKIDISVANLELRMRDFMMKALLFVVAVLGGLQTLFHYIK